MTPLTFKIATNRAEIEQINCLNYKTFAEEIPQHHANASKTLVDRFHNANTYIIGQQDNQVVGMVAIHDQRPFSLDYKLPALDSYLPTANSLCEIRLFAIEKTHRQGLIFKGLIFHLFDHCKRQSYDLAVISGVIQQQRLYKHLGFEPFGPLVGVPGAWFQPMYITMETFEAKHVSILHRLA